MTPAKTQERDEYELKIPAERTTWAEKLAFGLTAREKLRRRFNEAGYKRRMTIAGELSDALTEDPENTDNTAHAERLLKHEGIDPGGKVNVIIAQLDDLVRDSGLTETDFIDAEAWGEYLTRFDAQNAAIAGVIDTLKQDPETAELAAVDLDRDLTVKQAIVEAL